MEYIVPDCFKNFKCIADKCSDNCCIGWEIDVDDETYEYYKSITEEFGERIINNIKCDECRHFMLDNDERCPFLDENNLCEIIINLGEDRIPEICRNHPRFYNWLYDRVEMGIGLCCEEAGRRLFASPEKLNVRVDYKLTDDLSDILTHLRERAIEIAQNRDYSIFDRVKMFLELSKKADDCLINNNQSEIVALKDEFWEFGECKEKGMDGLEKLAILLKSLEPINNEWTQYVDGLCSNIDEIIKRKAEFFEFYNDKIYEYEHIFVYMLCRYYLRAVEDENLLPWSNFIVLSVLLIMLMDIYSFILSGQVDRIYNAKLFSKEVEYSQENIDLIIDASFDDFENVSYLAELMGI